MVAKVSTKFEWMIMDEFAGSSMEICPLERLARTSIDLFCKVL